MGSTIHDLRAERLSRRRGTLTEADKKTVYHRYIDCLNDRRIDELGEFVHEELAYNGEPMTRLDYQNLIIGNVEAIPDLYFNVHLLVVDGDQIACRLNFECTPQGEFLGLQPNGKSISFSEHVFYRLREGKIYEVWSLLDPPAIEEQLAA
jgi:predicted ester cyclase